MLHTYFLVKPQKFYPTEIFLYIVVVDCFNTFRNRNTCCTCDLATGSGSSTDQNLLNRIINFVGKMCQSLVATPFFFVLSTKFCK